MSDIPGLDLNNYSTNDLINLFKLVTKTLAGLSAKHGFYNHTDPDEEMFITRLTRRKAALAREFGLRIKGNLITRMHPLECEALIMECYQLYIMTFIDTCNLVNEFVF